MKFVLALVLVSAIAVQAYTPVEPSFATFLRPKLSAAKQAIVKLAEKVKGLPAKAHSAGSSLIKSAAVTVNKGIDAAGSAAEKIARRSPQLQAQIKQLKESAKQSVANVQASAEKALASGAEAANKILDRANQQLSNILEKTEIKLIDLYDKIIKFGEPDFN